MREEISQRNRSAVDRRVSKNRSWMARCQRCRDKNLGLMKKGKEKKNGAVDFHCTTVGQKKESGRFPQLQPFTYLSINHVKVQHKVFAHFGCQLRRLPPPRNVRPCSCHCGIVCLCFLSPFLTRGDRQNASQTFFFWPFICTHIGQQTQQRSDRRAAARLC